jgi:hypothetical protein
VHIKNVVQKIKIYKKELTLHKAIVTGYFLVYGFLIFGTFLSFFSSSSVHFIKLPTFEYLLLTDQFFASILIVIFCAIVLLYSIYLYKQYTGKLRIAAIVMMCSLLSYFSSFQMVIVIIIFAFTLPLLLLC